VHNPKLNLKFTAFARPSGRAAEVSGNGISFDTSADLIQESGQSMKEALEQEYTSIYKGKTLGPVPHLGWARKAPAAPRLKRGTNYSTSKDSPPRLGGRFGGENKPQLGRPGSREGRGTLRGGGLRCC